TQNPEGSLAAAAEVTGVAPENVYVHTCFLGGGFGRRSYGDDVRQAVTPTGKPPPLAVRLAKALPFRRASIEMKDSLIAHDDLHTADSAHACARLGIYSDHMARQGRRYGTYAMQQGCYRAFRPFPRTSGPLWGPSSNYPLCG